MGKIKKFGSILALSLLSLTLTLFTAKAAFAYEVRENQNLLPTEVVNGDLFITGENVNVEGTVNGNLFVFGTNVVVSGDVNGNVFTGGTTITISGNVSRTVYAGASTISITGNVGRDVFLGANQVTLDSEVGENAFIGAGALTFNKTIGENLYAGTGTLSLNGTVENDAFISTSSTNIDKTKVMGELKLDIQDNIESSKMREQEQLTPRQLASRFFAKLAILAGMYLLGLFLIKVFPVFFAKLNEEFANSYFKNFGIGLLVIFASPFAIIFLAITLVGLPFAAAYLGWMLIIHFITIIVAGRFVGKYLFKVTSQKSNEKLELLVGMLISSLLFMVPFIGAVLKFSAFAGALGASVSARKKALK